MKKSFKKYEKAGLPGGPNELKRFTQGFIISQRGQWDYPGLPTAVPTPTGKITMKGVEDDLLGIDNLGNAQYMTPGNNYQFEGDMVYEIPMGKKGGIKKPSKKYSKSLMSRNILFTKNPLLKKPKSVKNKIFDPNSPYFQPGGEIEYNQLPNNYKDALKNFVYPEVIDLPEETDSERYGYDAALGVIYQNPNNPIQNMNNPWWKEHELFHHLQNQAGAMSTYGAVGQRPNPYVASDEAIGSYYDRRGAEFDIELNKIFEQNPDISEEEAYAQAEENLYRNPTSVEGEARDYEGYIEAGNPSIFSKKQFGGVLSPKDLDPDTLKKYLSDLRSLENSIKKGYRNNKWYPHSSIEGGANTIAYGHKLQPGESFSSGLTEQEARDLQKKDVLAHQTKAEKFVDDKYGKGTYDKLPQNSQMLLTDYAYNLGSLNKFPSFVEGVVKGDKDKMLKEYERRGLSERNKWTKNVINTTDFSKKSNNNSQYLYDISVLLNNLLSGWFNKQDGGELQKASYGHSIGNLIRKQPGGETDAMNAMMKARLAYTNEFGNPAAQRMIVAPDNPYDFGNGMTGTHYMASMDNYAVPQIQDKNGQLVLGDYGPESNEAIRFDRPEDAEYFAKNYKNISPGFIELELDDNQIEEYRKGGYIIEDISVPSLTRMDNGGNPIKQLQEKEKAAELSRLVASGAAGGLGGMASYVAKEISKSQNKPSSNGSPARATAKPKMLAAVEKLASAPKTKPGDVNLAVRDFVQDAKEIDLKSKKDPYKDPYKEKDKIIYVDGDKMELKYPDADARYKQWVMNIEDKNKNQSYFEDFGDWINENIFGAESDIERAYRSTYNPVKPKTYYYNGRQVTGNGPWNNYGDAPVQMVYPEMFFMGPSGGAAGIAGNTLKSGFNYGKNVIWPALNRALPLGEGITTATAGKVTPFNIASLIFGSQSAANLADPNSESRKSLEKAYNNPTTSNILDAVGNVGLDALGILGSPGVTNMFGSAAGAIGKLFAGSDDIIPATKGLVKGLEKVPGRARPTNEQFKAVINKNINYIKSPEYKKLRMQNTGETSAQVDKAVNSYVKKINKTKLTSNKDDAFGTYTPGSLFSNPSINIDPYLMTPEKYLATFDHEIKHALSPFSGRGRYSLYKNYPILEGTPVYKEPSLKEVFFGKGKSPRAIDQQAANYHALPYEQQVRALRLKEKMKTDLGISAETPLTEDDVYNWMSNYKYSLPEELGDVDDLLKQIKVGSANAEKTINVMEQPRNMADWMNKAWMFVPGAGVAGAAAYGANDGANYKSGGLIEKKSSLLKADDGIEISDNSLFNDKLQEIADELGVTVDDLVGIMQHESRLNPSAVNPYTGAVGLIQFMPNTAKGLGTSIDALKQMSAVDQLDYVKKFYKPIAGKAKDIGDLYMYTFLPAAVGKPDDFVIGVKGSDSKVFGINQDALYKQNAVFDSEKKGYYTVGDVKKRISNFTGKSLTAPNRKKNIKRIPGKVEDTVKVIKRKHYVDSDKKEETIPVDPRIEQLAAFSKIMAPTSENIFQLYNQGMSSQMKYGGLTKMDKGGGIQGIEGLKEDFADRLSQFINDAKSQGINLKIGSGYRSYEKQKQLWEDALKKYGSAEVARKWVAPPGSSYHNKGLAVDLHDENSRALGKEENQEATAWAHANAKKYGLHFRMGNEPWHIEPIEFTGEDDEHTDENDITGDILIPDLQTESKVEYDDDYSDWSPNKKEVVTSDPRLQQLEAFSKIISPSSQNINMMFQDAIKGNMKKGGFILEVDDRDIQKYLDGGYIVEEID